MRRALVRAGLTFEDPTTEARFVARYILADRLAIQALTLACGVIFYVFFLWDRLIDPVHWQTAHLVRGGVVTPVIWACGLLLFIRPLQPRVEAIITAGLCIASIGLAVIYHVLDRGFDYGAVGFVLVILACVALFPMRIGYFAVFCAVTVVATAVAEAMSPSTRPGMAVVNALSILAAIVMGGISVLRRELLARAEMTLADEVQTARARIDDLLHSMLPAEIVARIQAGETAIADAHGEVSIVFADLVGFTALARRISATRLVELLNRFFSEFDLRAERHGLERIKTIGDAYMAVGGLSSAAASADHARSAALFALEIQSVVEDLAREIGEAVEVRVGLHIGPVVAGVIGVKRPAFDCWGETVNLASRLESAAKPGSVIVSEAAYWRLRPHFPVSALGEADLKGLGPTRVYLLGEPA